MTSYTSPRDDLLLPLLANPVPIHANFSAKDTVAIFSEGGHSSAHVVGPSYLGICQSTPEQWYPLAKSEVKW